MPSHAEIAAYPEPDAAFAKVIGSRLVLADSPQPPPLPANVDISALRQHTNVEKAEFREGLGGAGPDLTERGIKIPLNGRELDAYVYAPSGKFSAGSLPVCLFLHGGGFCLGSRFDDMEANRRLALEANIVVVSLEYRLAPEHPFPCAVYDGLEALRWITRNTNEVYPSASVSRGLIIGGTSAGANIANAVVYLNRDQDDSVQVTGQFLSVPPLLPLPVVPEKYKEYYLSFEQNHSITVLPPDLVGKFMEAYKPDINSPLFVPFNHPKGHSGAPPTYIQSEIAATDRLETEISTTVAIVGAGPVGLFTALLLAQAGIKVAVFETGSTLNQSPRAVAYFPAVLEEFKKAGILQDVIDKGEKNTDGCAWREPSGKVLAAVDPPPDSPQFAVCLSQPEFSEIAHKRLLETGNAEVVFNHTYQRHQQRGDSVLLWINSSSQETEVVCECQYLIGADGGRSEVRKALGVELKGFTWESLQLVAVNFQYPLSGLGWKQANFIVGEVSWGVVVKRGKGNSWRFATGTQAPDIGNGTLDDATVKVVKDRLMRLLPGDTSQIEWEAMAPYKVHQRCATTFRKGNVLLAGDAAHLNSPIGGLGLTTGLLDAAHLAESLRQTLLDKAEPIVLDQSQDPEHVRQRNEFFARLNKKDIATVLQVGLPDYALSSTSKTSFSTYEEVTWFITVTKLDDWSDERFTHEYKVVHANMTRQGKEQGAPTRRYTQYKNLYQKVNGTKQAGCNYVTCLVFPNLFLVHAGLQDPGYRATAGAHKFCRLDQQGCLTRKIAEFSKEGNGPRKSFIRALLFHERRSETDECSEDWVQERAAKFSTQVKSDDRAYGYVLWQDMTPKNSKTLFRDSQFDSGSWHNFKAVEAFDFLETASANTFLREYMDHITEGGKQTITAVVSDPDFIF
ncbi:hypothetical protein FANTH_14472 [Fusarium anthophilum]|uniref:FAD-binding domain-containing protein n=1 Tax=Fusarium anthophilum TaxID=48485 RepID=A0A8H5DM29_9HYPO|nr:hypothetical protein FANTH_14472 [Fusarium anthophilum]